MNYRIIFSIATAILLAFASNAQISEKFLKEAAEEVWSENLPVFNPATPIPDSVASAYSGIVIAMQYRLKADLNLRVAQTKLSEVGTNEGNYTDCVSILRSMVKLLDQSAVDLFSDFEFGNTNEKKFGSHSYYNYKNAFGARIHKPDGSIRDIDMNEALKIAHGKKGDKQDIQKIAIPGLEIGDVIEYFYYNVLSADEVFVPPFDIPLYNQYPIMNMIVDGVFDNNLTVEYRAINGVPDPEYKENIDGKNIIHLHLYNIPAVNTLSFTKRLRQLPYLRIAVLNNNSRIPHPITARKAGIYANIPPVSLYTDMRGMLIRVEKSIDKHPVFTSAKNHMKRYMKEHPQATKHQLIDAAYIAVMYSAMTEPEKKPSRIMTPLMMKRLVSDLGLDDNENTGIVLINSRSDANISDIIVWDEPEVAALADNRVYFFNNLGTYMPGEAPTSMQGEDGILMSGELSDPKMSPKMLNIAANMPSKNSYSCSAVLSLDDNMEDISASFDIKATGAIKSLLTTPITANGLILKYEDFLGVPENKSWKKKLSDSELFIPIEKINECISYNAGNFQGIDIADISETKFDNYGLMPESKGIAYTHKGKISGIVEDMGGDLLIKVGHIMGKRSKIDGVERSRMFPAFLSSTRQAKFKVTIITPEGYHPNKESLDQIAINAANPLGKVFANAKINDDGNVELNYMEQDNTFFINTDQWTDYLYLDDIATSIYDAAIVYTKD